MYIYNESVQALSTTRLVPLVLSVAKFLWCVSGMMQYTYVEVVVSLGW